MRYRGSPEPEVEAGCDRAFALIYWMLMLIALPPVIWEHLIHKPTPLIWLYLALPVLYLPLALGWFPRTAQRRLYGNAIALTALGLSTNAVYGWEPQPGIYFMIPAGLMAYALQGGRGLLLVMAPQMVAVAGTTLWLHPLAPYAGVAIALTTWLAVYGAAVTVMWHMLMATQHRAAERETMATRLREHRALLEENERSVHRIIEVGLGEAEAAADALLASEPTLDSNPALPRLRRAIDSVRKALG